MGVAGGDVQSLPLNPYDSMTTRTQNDKPVDGHPAIAERADLEGVRAAAGPTHIGGMRNDRTGGATERLGSRRTP